VKTALRLIAVLALLAPVSCSSKTPKSDTEKASYAIGQDIGNSLSRVKNDIDIDFVNQGLSDKIKGKDSKLSQEEMMKVMQAFQQKVQAQSMQQQSADGEKNKTAGAAFLDKNKANPKVKVTKSGLQYEVLKAGTGAKPKSKDKVRVHYTGTLVDGSVFDSSVQRGQPAEFPVGGVIPGWVEALQMMPVGSKWRLAIPGSLAYGPSGHPPQIGPDAVLIFEVELLAIIK
jgi:FKBP-type peptidyl-prolyl cis-trans isomerase